MSRGMLRGICTSFVLAGVVAGCPASRSRFKGPPPEYERPAVAPWDAGVVKPDDDFDPFAAAAESEWIGGEPETPNTSATGGEVSRAQSDTRGGAAGSSP